jgi:hypothetical protein
MSESHDECAKFLRTEMAAMGVDVTVSTARPLIAGPYTTDAFVCPHKVDFWLEPTGEQIAKWVEAGTR